MQDNDLYNLSLKLRLSIGFPENLFQNDLTTGTQYGDLLAIIFTQNVDSNNELDFKGFINFVKCGVNRDFVDTSLEPQQIDALLKIYAQGIIDQEELLKKLIEGEVLSEDINIEDMLNKTMQ